MVNVRNKFSQLCPKNRINENHEYLKRLQWNIKINAKNKKKLIQ